VLSFVVLTPILSFFVLFLAGPQVGLPSERGLIDLFDRQVEKDALMEKLDSLPL